MQGEHVANSNYGDVALTLPANWNRRAQSDQAYALNTIGHTDGVSDVRLKDEPEQKHQFAWVEPRYRDEISLNQSKGYRFVKKDDGWVAESLWEWDAEGFLIRADGQRLMARSFERFLEDMAARKEQRDRVMNTSRVDEDVARLAAKFGISITGDGGKPVKRVRSGLRNNG